MGTRYPDQDPGRASPHSYAYRPLGYGPRTRRAAPAAPILRPRLAFAQVAACDAPETCRIAGGIWTNVFILFMVCAMILPPVSLPVSLPLPDPADRLPAMAGQRLARGVARLMRSFGLAPVEEMPLAGKLRADILALGPRGEIWIVECKSCRADFRADHKWQGYLDYCDRFFWAVGPDFPENILPAESGLILADAFGGEIIRMPLEQALAPARRKTLTRDFARHAAWRLMALRDPGP